MIKRLQVIGLSLRVNLSIQSAAVGGSWGVVSCFPPCCLFFHCMTCSTSSHVPHHWPEALLSRCRRSRCCCSSAPVERVLNVICISAEDSEACNIPDWHTFTALPGVQRRRSDDTCDLVDAVVAKQPSQNSMPAIHYSNSSDSNSLLPSCVRHTKCWHTLCELQVL